MSLTKDSEPSPQPKSVEPACAGANASTRRIRYIDTTRGLLFFLMTSAHALTLAELPQTSLLGSGYLLPREGSFQTFIILSGFTAALIFSWEKERAKTRRRLWRRAAELLAVMFVSNVVMLVLKFALDQELDRVTNLSWWLGLFTLQTPYSISGVLLPIALFLFLTPGLFALYHKFGPRLLALGIGLFAVLVWGVQPVMGATLLNYHWLDVLFRTGAGGFPVLPLVSYGAVGFLLGQWWKRAGDFNWRLGILLLLVFLALVWVHRPSLPLAVYVLYLPFLGISRFTLFLAGGMTITKIHLLDRGLGFLPIMGKYALFSFVMHRIVMQALALINLRWFPPTSAEAAYVIYLVGTLLIVTLLCLLRQRFPRYDQALKKLFL